MNKNLIHSQEKVLYAVALTISILVYLILFLSIIGIFYVLIGFIISFFIHGIMIGNIKNNAVKITDNQFKEIKEKVEEISLNMGLSKIPDIYVIESAGVLNAFATKFFGRDFIVLYSDIFEIYEKHEKELFFIIAHELAHIQRKHISKKLFILPAMWIPFLGNAYSRACEFTSDRIAAAYIKDREAAVKGITILAIGKRLFSSVNVEDYILQHKKETGFFVWFSRVLSTHPPLPKRIEEIRNFDLDYQMQHYHTYNLSGNER